MKKLGTSAITLICLLHANMLYSQNESSSESLKIIYVEQVKCLDSLFAKFKGQIIYVDFWASWCASCIEEFTKDPELDMFLKTNNIIRLYIALEKTEKDSAMIMKSMERWETLVNKYDLKGFNYYVQLRSVFFSGITEKIMKGKLSLPRYSIVDENGVIVEKDAKRPSNAKGLIKQISGYLKNNN